MEALETTPDLRECLEERLREKYPQYVETQPFLGPPVALRFEVRSERGWCADPSSLPDLGT